MPDYIGAQEFGELLNAELRAMDPQDEPQVAIDRAIAAAGDRWPSYPAKDSQEEEQG
jgi:hypothetical protein